MSQEFFIGISLVVIWALLPASVALSMTWFDEENQSDPHEH